MSARLTRRSFRPRWWGAAFALAACAAGVSLGNWQGGRADEKRSLAAQREAAAGMAAVVLPALPADPAELVQRRVRAHGRFVPESAVLLDNKVYRGRPGYYVIMPLRIAGGTRHVLVNRGWIAGGARRDTLPVVQTPAGEVVIEGIALAHAPRVLAAGSGRPEGRVWLNLDFADYSRWSGLAVQPILLEQRSDLDDGLVRDWPAPDRGIERHESYALQWYLLAGLSIVLFVVLSFRDDYPPSR